MKIPEETQKGFLECEDSGTAGMIRVSFGIYNTEEEVDQFLKDLAKLLPQGRKDMQVAPFIPEY